MYKLVIRPILFLFPAEFIHNFSFIFLKVICNIPLVSYIIKYFFTLNNQALNKSVFNLKFKNRIGLAAGFDKNAFLIKELSLFGFGHIEIGTVTPNPQRGNNKPRLFRLKNKKSLLNNMGFNNDGVDLIVKRLKRYNGDCIIGANIGKNKDTLNENAWNDYLICFKKLFHLVDYFVVNLSSPNTPGLRNLLNKKPLSKLLECLQNENNKKKFSKPILLKISPDNSFSEIDEIIDVVIQNKIDGIVATNTSLDRSILSESNLNQGGISGSLVENKSTEIIRYISKKTNGTLPIIGVGGVSSYDTMMKKINAGATIVQVYTGWIYEGPSLIRRINKIMIDELLKN